MARWAIASLGRGADRRAEAAALEAALAARGLLLGGFRQEALPSERGKAEGLVRIPRGERMVLGADSGVGGGEGCTFQFREEAFATARRWLQEDQASAEVVLVHDVGKLEVKGEGHARAIAEAIGAPSRGVVLLIAGGDRLLQVVERFAPDDRPAGWIELPAAAAELDRFARELSEAAREAERL